MRSDGVWHRIRWGNVARLCALVALAALVAAWPRLGGDPPRLPPAEPVPVAGGHSGGASRGERPRARPQGGARARGGATGGEGKRPKAKRQGGQRPRDGAASGDGERPRGGAAGGEGKPPHSGRTGGDRKPPRSGVTGAERGPRPVAPPRVVPAPVARRPPPDPAAVEFGLP
jgi:hypothetical protein